jgi:hypothetical protein
MLAPTCPVVSACVNSLPVVFPGVRKRESGSQCAKYCAALGVVPYWYDRNSSSIRRAATNTVRKDLKSICFFWSPLKF